MKTISVFCSCAVLAALVSCGKQPSPTGWDQAGLKGRVQSVNAATTFINFENGRMMRFAGPRDASRFDEKGRLVSFTRVDSNGQLVLKVDYRYNDRGIKTEETSTGPNGVIGKKTFQYNNRDKIAMETEFAADGTTTNRSTQYVYDPSGKNLLAEKSTGGERTEHVYDAAGNRVETVTYGNGGQVELRVKNQYSTNGILLGSASYDYRDKLTSREEYLYNLDNRMSERREYSPADKLTVVHQYQYDLKGLLSEELIFTADGKTLLKRQSIHDIKGNLVTVMDYGADDILISKTGNNYDRTGNPEDQTVTEYVYRKGVQTGYKARNIVTKYEYYK